MFQWSGVTLAQPLATLTVPRTQTPPVLIASAPAVTQVASTTAIAATPAWETRARRKCPRGTGHTSTAPNSENFPPNLRDSLINVVGAPAYTHSFTVDGVPFLAIDRVRPWRKGCGGKVAESVGKALLLPEDMKHWAKWDDNPLLLNMKKEAIMVINSSLSYY